MTAWCLHAVSASLLSAAYVCRSILCNSTNMPFGGTGGSADTGGHVGGIGAGNGARTGTAKGAADLASQGAFLQAPEAIPGCERSCILLWGMLSKGRQGSADTWHAQVIARDKHHAMWVIGRVSCRHHWHDHHWHNRSPHRHNWSPHWHNWNCHRPDSHRWRQCSPDCVMTSCGLLAHTNRCPPQATLAACDLCTAPTCFGSSLQQVAARL